MSAGFEALGERLAARLRDEPDAEACRLVFGDGEERAVTTRELLEKAMAYAELYGPPRPDPGLIGVCLYHGLDLLAAFLGALWAGHIPTMLPPPSPRMDHAKYTGAFRQMLEHIQPSCLVIDAPTHEKLGALSAFSLAEVTRARVIRAESVAARGSVAPWPSDPDSIALLQHSSGTTGLQKGIALSHRAILSHNAVYAERIGLCPADVIVSWLPLYHDMGLIACFLLPVLSRVRFIEISPFDWVLRPAMLLEKIHEHGATLCWLPNFAFSFLAESVKDESLPEGMSLRSIRAFINSSEPVYHRSFTQFAARFAPYGARMDQLTASYAMAENVYAVTQSLPGRTLALSVDRRLFTEEHRIEPSEDPSALVFCSNGAPVEGTELSVLDDAGAKLPEGHVGELALRGKHRFSGYFRKDELTARAMTEDGWYKTGDLGFVHQGEVFVTGRKKDLIIIKGRNYYPTDIEDVVARVPGIAPGRVVAFGLPDEESGTEKLIILAEAKEGSTENEKKLALKVRSAVSLEMDCTPGDVRIVPSRSLIKSTSGKLARGDNRDRYLLTHASSSRS